MLSKMADAAHMTAEATAFVPEIPTSTGISPATTILSNDQQAATITINPGGGFDEFSIPPNAYSLSGFREWALSEQFPQRGRITFSHEGLIVDMTPEALETHNYIKADVSWVVQGLIRQRQLGRFLTDGALFSNEQANICTEPDAMFISGVAVKSGRCTLIESKRPGINIEVVGSPDWILEVVSQTSIRKDKVILRNGYFRAGVSEYWIIDALQDEIDFQILVPGEDEYQPVTPINGWLSSSLFGCSFRLSVSKDKDGFLQYVLHTQETS